MNNLTRLISCSLLILPYALVCKCQLHSVNMFHHANKFGIPSQQTLIRRIREATLTADSGWKPTKTPTFVTTQMKKQYAEPTLTVFPSEGSLRSGKSRELVLPEYNDAKRIIYYSVLPDVSPHSTRQLYDPYGEFVKLSEPLRSNQRSYDANKAGKDFVTRVKSAVINVSGEDKNKDNQKSSRFKIMEAPPSSYPMNSISGVRQPAGYLHNKHMTGIEYHQTPYDNYHKAYIRDFKLPYSNSLPHYNVGNNIESSPYHYQQQSSPYYDEVEKIHGPVYDNQYNQPPLQHLSGVVSYQSSSYPTGTPSYPTRHIRFPAHRYSVTSQFADLLSPSRPHVSSHLSDLNFPEHSPNLGLSGNAFGSNFNNNLGPVTMDHNFDIDDNKFFNKPLRNKVPSFGYDSPNNLNFDFPNFNSPFSSSISDSTVNAPFDRDAFNSAVAAMNNKVTGEKDFYVKGSSSPEAETQNPSGSSAENIDTESNKALTTASTTPSDENTEEIPSYME